MDTQHTYEVEVEWTGAGSEGTATYRSYSRQHVVRVDGLPDILGSADRTFHGDADRHNPEQLLLAALAQCHMLSYLHQAAAQGIVVTAYTDEAEATLETIGKGGKFVSATLRPTVTITDRAQFEAALLAHHAASENCFIAQSVAFPIRHEITIRCDGRPIGGTTLGGLR